MAGRRGNSEGSITKRADGRWESRIVLPDGKRKSFYGKTRKEVESKLAQARRDAEVGLPLVDQRQSIGQYLESWLPSVRYLVDGSSWLVYRLHVQRYLIPALGTIPLVKLTAQRVQAFYTEMVQSGLSTTTVRLSHQVLHRALKDAFRLELIQRNVLDMVQAPKVKDREMKTFSQQQVRDFLRVMRGDPYYSLYVLALTTAMREGELLALRWQDIDLERGILHVRLGLQVKPEGGYILAAPKSKHSKRRIMLTKKAVKALRLQRLRVYEQKRLLGPDWDNEMDFVFPNAVGGYIPPRYLRGSIFPAALKKAGLPRIRFHDLRHTCATLLLSRGVNVKVVSEMLGHSDIAITLRVYGHVLPDMQQTAVQMMDTIVDD